MMEKSHVFLNFMDPTVESGIRFRNMTIPTNMSSNQRDMLEKVLMKVQDALHKTMSPSTSADALAKFVSGIPLVSACF